MHTLSTRTLSALAFDRGEEYDPGQPPCASLLDQLVLAGQAGPLVGDEGPYERARRRRREQRERAGIPAWFSVEDLLSDPWEQAVQLLA